MFTTRTAWFFVAAAIFAVSQAQFLQRSSYACPPSRVYCDSCGSALDDLSILLQLAKAFDGSDEVISQGSLSDDIITKLVNALVYTATQSACGGKGGAGSGGTGSGAAGGGAGAGLIGGGGGGALSGSIYGLGSLSGGAGAGGGVLGGGGGGGST